MTSVLACAHCGKRNRVPASAGGTPSCGHCHQPLPWIVDAGDDDFAEVAERSITVEIGEGARRFIAHEGYDPVYGARPLRRFIAREVETQVARALLRDGAIEGSTVRVDVGDDQLVVSHETIGAQA